MKPNVAAEHATLEDKIIIVYYCVYYFTILYIVYYCTYCILLYIMNIVVHIGLNFNILSKNHLASLESLSIENHITISPLCMSKGIETKL